jgi:hypothetical protein
VREQAHRPVERKVREFKHGDHQKSEEGKEAGADSSAMAPSREDCLFTTGSSGAAARIAILSWLASFAELVQKASSSAIALT